MDSGNLKSRRDAKKQFCVVHKNYWYFQGWSHGDPCSGRSTGLGTSTWKVLRNVVCNYALTRFALFLNSSLDFEWSNMEATSRLTNLSTFFLKKGSKINTDWKCQTSQLGLWNSTQGLWWQGQHIIFILHDICCVRKYVKFVLSVWRNASYGLA